MADLTEKMAQSVKEDFEVFIFKGVRVSIKSGCRDKQNLNRVIIIIIHFFIKSVRMAPCVVEHKNRFIFENKITFDVWPLNTAKISV